MFCPRCGESVAENAKFCRKCGLELNMARKPASGRKRGATYEPRAGVQRGVKMPGRPEPVSRAPKQKSRSASGKNAAVIAVLVLIVLAMAGLGIWFFLFQQDGTPWKPGGDVSGNAAMPSIPTLPAAAETLVPTQSPTSAPTPTPLPELTPSPTPEPPDDLVMSNYYSPTEADRLYFSYADASSEILHNGIYYSAEKAMDDDPNTSWQEDAEGYGIGEYITLYFSRTQTVGGIMLFPGFDQSESAWERNCRPAKLLVELSDGSSYEISVNDIRDWQGYEFLTPVETEYLRFTILDVYPGTEWEDTAITEIRAYERSDR